MTRPLRTAALLALLLWPAVAGAAPADMSRDEIIDLARSGVSYSYWWGHGRWRSDGAQHGSCSGSCPGCNHSGSYGADCSGFVAKAWQVPSPSPVTTDAHPYSTREFRYNTTHWTRISREQATRADAFVYRNSANTGGHIVLYESGDAWGQIWAYEARGCSYGIVHNLRSLSSAYIGIRRVKLVSAPATGTLKGVVFVDRGQGTADMTERIPGAQVAFSGAGSVTARDGDAQWSKSVAPGSYTVTASASGYQSASRSCSVTAGGESWCSMGLAPVCVPDCSGRSCGADPRCGTSCGSCSGDDSCTAAGQCQAPACQADCAGRQCGADPVCGSSCGSCAGDEQCDADGQCQPAACQPDCSGRSCGADPVCGEPCGSCGEGASCDADGQCQPESCAPDCSTRSCGADPVCGQSCGSCAAEQFCSAEGSCVDSGATCQPDCGDQVCGLDPLCGSRCGSCADGAACDEAGQCQALGSGLGLLRGRVVDATDLDPDATLDDAPGLAHATVQVAAQSWAQTDLQGDYELVLAEGEHQLLASAPGYQDGTARCSVVAGGTELCVLGLTRAPTEPKRRLAQVAAIGEGWSCAAVPAANPLMWLALLALRRRRR